MSRATWPGTLNSGRRAADYCETSRQADNATRALFMSRTPLERERMPNMCIPSGSGKHRAEFWIGNHERYNDMHGMLAARRYREL